MARTTRLALAVLLLVGAGKPQDEDAKKAELARELARFQGTWQLVSAESEGKKAPEENVKQVTITIKGNTHTVRFGDEVVAHGVTFEIDPAKTPKWATDTINEGPGKGKQILGIYKIEGDMLTSCVAPVGKERPAEFVAKEGSGHTLRVFKRAAKEEKKPGTEP